MDTKKFLLGTVIGGLVLFFLGYLFYGLALASFFSQHVITSVSSMKAMSDIIWWALILGNIAWAALLTYIFLKLGNIKSFGSGASTGAVIGFLMSLSIDLTRYATENTLDRRAWAADVIIGMVMCAIAGGIIGVVLGAGSKKL